jgi:hypothetical protein
MAFSDKAQNLTLYYSPRQTGATSSQNITENKDATELQIRSNTVDGFVEDKGISRLDFIKCDVEGAELFVFKGAIHSLEKFRPIVFSEMLRKWSAKFDYHPNDIMALFSSLGYHCFFVEDKKLKKTEVVTEDTIATNFFFLHPVKHKKELEKYGW